jgi:hypothetical protein
MTVRYRGPNQKLPLATEAELVAEMLTAEERAELDAYAAKHGRTWKDRLLDDWMQARLRGTLHRLRNVPYFGPKGLKSYKPGTAPAAPAGLARSKREALIAALTDLQSDQDTEGAHRKADLLLLAYIGDPEIEEAYNDVPKWYA